MYSTWDLDFSYLGPRSVSLIQSLNLGSAIWPSLDTQLEVPQLSHRALS